MGKRIILVGSIDDDHNRLLKLFKSYSNAGYETIFVGMDRLARREKHCFIDGMECFYLTRGWGYSNWRLLFGYPIWGLCLILHFLTIKADFVHAFELETAFPVALVLNLRKIPYIFDVQDNYDLRRNWPFPLKQIISALDRWVISKAAGVIVPDENRIVGALQGYRDKVIIVPNCPPDIPADENIQVDRDGLTILAMGELSKRRGIDLLLETVEQEPSIRVLMAGRFTDSEVEAKALGMSQVEFKGWIPWTEAIGLGYQADVVFAFYDPAYKVNLLANAQKWFDAMMTATPILSNKEINNSTWIERENIGYICPYGDKEALKNILHHIIENPADAEEKGRRARVLYDQRYNWALMERKIMSLVKSILAVS